MKKSTVVIVALGFILGVSQIIFAEDKARNEDMRESTGMQQIANQETGMTDVEGGYQAKDEEYFGNEEYSGNEEYFGNEEYPGNEEMMDENAENSENSENEENDSQDMTEQGGRYEGNVAEENK